MLPKHFIPRSVHRSSLPAYLKTYNQSRGVTKEQRHLSRYIHCVNCTSHGIQQALRSIATMALHSSTTSCHTRGSWRSRSAHGVQDEDDYVRLWSGLLREVCIRDQLINWAMLTGMQESSYRRNMVREPVPWLCLWYVCKPSCCCVSGRLTCCSPSHIYTYSFEPNPNWSTFYAYGPEIRQYFENFAAKYDLMPFVKLNHRVLKCEWIEEKGICPSTRKFCCWCIAETL